MKIRARLAAVAIAVGSCGVVTWTCAHRPSSAPGHAQGRLEHQGRVRTFISWAPDGPGPFPLVIALHGRLGSGAQMLELSSLTSVAQREGFVVVYPDGVGRSWADARGTSPASKERVDDEGFLLALIDAQLATGRVDPKRVYLVGMSNGGFMALTFACRHAERVAAVGSVTGFMAVALETSCAPSRPVPVAVVAGDTDPVVPFEGGDLQGGRGAVLGAEATFATWARLDGCAPDGTVTLLPDVDPTDGTRVERRELAGCRDGAAVRLDVVKGGGHTWPGGDRYLPERVVGTRSADVDASVELWRFLSRFSR